LRLLLSNTHTIDKAPSQRYIIHVFEIEPRNQFNRRHSEKALEFLDSAYNLVDRSLKGGVVGRHNFLFTYSSFACGLVAAVLVVIASPLAQAEERLPLKFDHQVQTCASAESVWADFQLALVDSSQAQIWPSDLSKVEGEAKLGAKIYVTYGNGWFAPTYSYELVEYGDQAFRYEAREDHPFIGGARVSVESLPDGSGSILKWDGLYLIKESDARGRNYFNSFSRDFFARLDQNLKAFEETKCDILSRDGN
jgi:hypothetical protein